MDKSILTCMCVIQFKRALVTSIQPMKRVQVGTSATDMKLRIVPQHKAGKDNILPECVESYASRGAYWSNHLFSLWLSLYTLGLYSFLGETGPSCLYPPLPYTKQNIVCLEA